MCVRLVGFVIKSQSLKTWCCLFRLPNSTLELGRALDDGQSGMSLWNVWGAGSSACSNALDVVPCSQQLCKLRAALKLNPAWCAQPSTSSLRYVMRTLYFRGLIRKLSLKIVEIKACDSVAHLEHQRSRDSSTYPGKMHPRCHSLPSLPLCHLVGKGTLSAANGEKMLFLLVKLCSAQTGFQA